LINLDTTGFGQAKANVVPIVLKHFSMIISGFIRGSNLPRTGFLLGR
jgi:hypothetical protein